MKRLQDQLHLNWLMPNELFERFLDVTRLADGTTIREELERIRDGEAFADQVLSQTDQTPEDVILYKQKREEWDAARNTLMELMEEEFLGAGAEGQWLAIGRRSPFVEEEIIPPHYWDFLTLDRAARNAKSEGHGLEVSGLRCLILQDLPREWRLHVLAELDEINAAIREAGSRPPVAPYRKANAGPKSKRSEMVNAFRELFSTGAISKIDLANKKGVWNKVLSHLEVPEGARGYSYNTFITHVSPEIDKALKNRNLEN